MKPVKWSMISLALCAAAAHAQPRPVDEDRAGRTLYGLLRRVDGEDVEQVLRALARAQVHLDAGEASVARYLGSAGEEGSPLLRGASGVRVTLGADATAPREVVVLRAAPARVTARWGGKRRELILEPTVRARVERGVLTMVSGVGVDEVEPCARTAGLVGALGGEDAVEAATIDAPLGADLPTFGAPPPPPPHRLLARFERTTFAGRKHQGKEGSITINGNAYRFRTGGFGDGHLPTGEYTATPHRWSRSEPGFSVGGVGWSVALTDKHDPRVGRVRSLLRIHPDGNGPGTEGCLGIVGDAAAQARCREDLRAELERGGGSFILVVSE